MVILHNKKINNSYLVGQKSLSQVYNSIYCVKLYYFFLTNLYSISMYAMFYYTIFFYRLSAVQLNQYFLNLDYRGNYKLNFVSTLSLSKRLVIYFYYKFFFKFNDFSCFNLFKRSFVKSNYFPAGFSYFKLLGSINNVNNLNFHTHEFQYLIVDNFFNLKNAANYNLNLSSDLCTFTTNKFFNFLQLLNNKSSKDLLLSNYNLFLLRQYLNSFNYRDSNKLVTNYDSKILTKNFFFFEFFLKKFIERTVSNNVCLTFVRNDIDFILNNQYYLMFLKRIKKLQVFNKDINLVRELVEVLIVSLYTYDVICFKNWLIKVAEKIHFKLHKRLFYIIKIIIAKYFSLYFKYFGCLGFCLRVQGKIGLGGSSKTRSFWVKSGQFSLTKKKLKINYTSGHIRTYSGVLGVEIILSYT